MTMRKITVEDLQKIYGSTIEGYRVEFVRIKKGHCTDSDHYGILLGKRISDGYYVVWQWHFLDDESVSVYWGFYTEDREAAMHNYETRDLGAQSFKVTITETLRKTVEVEAKDQDEATQMVSDKWKAGEVILDAECFQGVEVEAAKEHEAGLCPACGSDALDYDGFVVEDNLCVYSWKCKGCGVRGKEYHTLKFGEHVVDGGDE
jgi:hypothetical protein